MTLMLVCLGEIVFMSSQEFTTLTFGTDTIISVHRMHSCLFKGDIHRKPVVEFINHFNHWNEATLEIHRHSLNLGMSGHRFC